jgi:7tm Chemosensory receptor
VIVFFSNVFVCRLSALGFFDVGRSSLVGMLSTILTYLIILIQFDQGKEVYQLSNAFAYFYCVKTVKKHGYYLFLTI